MTTSFYGWKNWRPGILMKTEDAYEHSQTAVSLRKKKLPI